MPFNIFGILEHQKQDTSEEKYGTGTPSTRVVHWARSGRDLEFEPFTTSPQQDLQLNKMGITIHPITDNRAQPFNQFVRANMHREKVHALPAKDATKEEVREFLYFVLASKRFGTVADEKPWLVVTTLDRWKGNGDKLRELCVTKNWNKLCPREWTNIYNEKCYNTTGQRKLIGKILKSAILPFLEHEARIEEIETFKNKDEKSSVRSSKPKKKFLRKITTALCFGTKETHKEEVIPPLYLEKMVVLEV